MQIVKGIKMSESESETMTMGSAKFQIDVPYRIIETGEKSANKPLIIYLHGFGQNLNKFEEKCSTLKRLDAYHCFIQGPYPIYDRRGRKDISDWGYSWYLYDGNSDQFVKALEKSSQFLQGVINKLLNQISPNRISVIGYSMGGYLAGYFSLTRPDHVNDLIVCAARIKTEVLNDQWESVRKLNVLALHGKNDELVKPEPQQKEIERLRKNNVKAELKLIDENHSFSESYIQEIFSWLKKEY